MNYNNIILFLSVLLFPSIYFAKEIYICADELEIDTCLVEAREENDNIYYVKGCSKGKKCREVEIGDDRTINKCMKDNELREEGDSCLVDEECQSDNCVNKTCTHVKDGDDCLGSKSCNKNSRCKWTNEEEEKGDICVALVGQGSNCKNDDDCKFGLLCNRISDSGICTELFSLADGKESSEDFLCASGRRYKGKCATTKVFNSTCTQNQGEELKCQISLEGSTESEYISCQNEVCPLQSDSEQLKEYIKVYSKEREKMKKEDIDKIHVALMGDKGRFTLNGNKNVVKAYVNLMYYKEIEDNDCVKDYFITILESKKLEFSKIISSLLFLFML